MDIGIVSMRYAKALMEYAKSTGTEDRLYTEMRTPVGQELSRFVTLILKNRREAFLQYICLSYLDLYRKSRHIGVAKLTTAVPVSREIWERIRNSASHLLHAKMELQTDVDPSIEGGFIFDINDFRLDASIATQLKKVKQQFIDKNRRIV